MPDPSETLRDVCSRIGAGDLDGAAALVRRDYPFRPVAKASRRYNTLESLRVFLRDGFVDRYSGKRLLNPAVLRLVSAYLPGDFPAHPNWKQSESHIGFWELSPTIDHLVPVARGGLDSEENWVTASMIRNSAKGNAMLAELGWELQPPGDLDSWDGLTGWIVAFWDSDRGLSGLPTDGAQHRRYIQTWASASQRALAEGDRL